MRVFLTGGTGFVGSHVAAALSEGGHDVHFLVRDPARLERLRERGGPAPAGTPVRGDLEDGAALRRGCEGADVVLHVAGLTAARGRAEFFRVNEGGTRRLVEAAREAAQVGVRLLYVSSLAAAGPTARGTLAKEGESPHPVSHYGRSKLAGEEVVRNSGLAWTIVRPPGVYGPGDEAFLRLFRMAARGRAPVFGDGSQELSLVHVRDLAAAIHACLDPRAEGRTYYATHPEVCTARELVGRVGNAVGELANGESPSREVRLLRIPRAVVRPILFVTGGAAWLSGRATMLAPDKAAEFLAEAWTCSSRALQEDTGWRARIDLEEGLSGTARWYRSAGWL